MVILHLKTANVPEWFLVTVCNFVINEFNPTFSVQNMGNEAFALFGNASFQTGMRVTVASGQDVKTVNIEQKVFSGLLLKGGCLLN